MANGFSNWLRTGRGPSGRIEVKFNPWHDPEDGRFTFRNSGRYFGDDANSSLTKRPRRDDPRVQAIGMEKRREAAKNKPPVTGFRPSGGSFGGAGATATGLWGPGVASSPRPTAKGRSATGQTSVRLKIKPPRPTSPTIAAPNRSRPRPASAIRSTPTIASVDQRNGYSFARDIDNRTRDASGELRLQPGKRNKRAQLSAGKPDRRVTNEGGHYIGVQFDGPREEFSHFAQDRNFNRSRYQKLERKWAGALGTGKKVHVRIKVSYENTLKRPDKLSVTSIIDGKPKYEEFKNEPGQRARAGCPSWRQAGRDRTHPGRHHQG